MSCATSSHSRCAHGDQGWTDPGSRLYTPLNRRVVRSMERSGETNSLIIRNDILSFRLRCNHPDRPNDVGGAFMPHSYYFSYYNFAPIKLTYIVDNGECALANGQITNPISYLQRKLTVLNFLDSLRGDQPKSVIAFFSHGWETGFQFGFKTNTNVLYRGSTINDVEALATAIARIATPDVIVILYACLTGADDNGFAAQLRDRLVVSCPDCRVDAHKTLGHSTKNPFVNRFESPAGSAGQMVVPHGHRLWNKWRRILSDPFGERSTLLWKFSQMTITEIHEHLDSI